MNRVCSRSRPRATHWLPMVLLGLVFSPLSAVATTWPASDLDTLRAHASLVVRARVVAHEARWLAGTGSARIVTFYTLAPQERLAGTYEDRERKSARVTLGVPGGEVGEYGQKVHGAPIFEEGSEVLLFLGPAEGPSGARGLVGLGHGAFLVAQAPEGTLLRQPWAEPAPPGPSGGPAPPALTLEFLRTRLVPARALP